MHVTVGPHEILAPGVPVAVVSPVPLDPRAAQSGIRLRGERATVTLSSDGRTATVRAARGAELAPGRHTLVVDELVSAEGDRLPGHLEVPFVVSDTRAPLGPNVRVETLTRLVIEREGTRRVSVHEYAEGPYVELVKATDRKTGMPVDVAFDHTGRKVDPDALFAEQARHRLERYGRLQPQLAQLIERAPEEPFPVAIWLRVDPVAMPDLVERSPDGPTEEPPAIERRIDARYHEMARRFADEIAGQLEARDIDVDPAAPVVFLTATGKALARLAHHEDVAAVLHHPTGQIVDLGSSMAIANSDDVQNLGVTGTGVNVAVWEDGPDKTDDLPIVAEFDPLFAGTSQHARHTHGIVANTEASAPNGHAPDCNLHSANRNGTDALRWAVRDRGCTVVSQSFHRSSEPGSGALQSDDVYKDWLALRWPYPTIVQAAGNFWSGDPDGISPPEDEFVNHKTYNGLVVGNHDDSAGAMSGSSVFRNPTTPHGDRELPEIAANGTAVTTVGLTMSGTSMAAPAVAGCVALLQDQDATLRSWPEGCRAVVMAGASRNPDGGTWWADVSAGEDAADGAGAVDALESLRIVQSRQRRDNHGSRRGWDVGTLRSSDIGADRMATFVYRLTVPSRLYGSTAKVALAWDSSVASIDLPFLGEILFGSHLTVDLDLMIYDSAGALVGYSGSWDNSYEIAEFRARPGETYTIRIRRWSGTDSVWFGIAWTLHGGFLLPIAVEGIGSIVVRDH